MAKPKEQTDQPWANRIVKSGEQPADQFLAHEMNARRHPGAQRDALRGSLNAVGWIAPVIVSTRSGKMLDGHARVEEALSRNDIQLIPYIEVDVSEDEEHLILATFDPITGLASHNREALDALLASIQTDDIALQSLMSDMAAAIGLVEGDRVEDVWKGMPEFENESITFRTILVHFEDQESIDNFAKHLNQTITSKTKFLWFPYKPETPFSECSVVDEKQ
jgi:hypothetical protein